MAMLGNGLSLDGEQAMKMPGYAQFVSVDRELEKVTVLEGADFFSVLQNLCVYDQCQVVARSGKGFEPISWDASHLTRGGSMMLAKELLDRK
jgi:hypothetical protein